MLAGANLIIFHVADMDATLPFYTDKLGMKISQQGPGFVQFSGDGGATLALSQEPNLIGAGGPEAWWFVGDADSIHNTLTSRDVAITDPLTDMPFGRTFSVQDPAGNKLYLLQLPDRG